MTTTLEEHFAYLSQARRTELFRQALARIVQPGDVVADLGCGFGMLGMLALEAGAARCYGIDHSDAIEIARETVRREGLEDRYTVIRGSTFATTLPEPVDLLVCDHVGYFGFDYGVIAMLDDARARLLKPGGRVVPGTLELRLGGVQSDAGRDTARRWQDPAIPAQYHWLHEQSVNSTHGQRVGADDLLTAEQAVALVDLASPAPDSLVVEHQLAITCDGRFDGIGGWFACTLAPGVTMTNSPLDPAAVARAQLFLPCRESFAVKAGDTVGLRLAIRHDPLLLAWTITPPGGAARQAMSTWRSTVLSPADLKAESSQPLSRSPHGEARLAVLQLLDGSRNAEEIVRHLLETRRDLFTSEAELSRFVARELRSASA